MVVRCRRLPRNRASPDPCPRAVPLRTRPSSPGLPQASGRGALTRRWTLPRMQSPRPRRHRAQGRNSSAANKFPSPRPAPPGLLLLSALLSFPCTFTFRRPTYRQPASHVACLWRASSSPISPLPFSHSSSPSGLLLCPQYLPRPSARRAKGRAGLVRPSGAGPTRFVMSSGRSTPHGGDVPAVQTSGAPSARRTRGAGRGVPWRTRPLGRLAAPGVRPFRRRVPRNQKVAPVE